MKNKSLNYLAIVFLSLSFTSCNSNKFQVSKIEEEVDNDQITYQISDAENHVNVFENNNYQVTYREKTDVFQIKDKRNNYTWKTGIDVDKNTSYCSLLYPDNRNARRQCGRDNPIVEDGMEDIYLSLANSFITVEMYQIAGGNNSVYYVGSSYSGVKSKLYNVVGENNHFKLVVDYSETKNDPLDITIKADIYFNEQGYDVKILDQNIQGKDTYKIKSILVTPFLGSSGGKLGIYDNESNTYVSQDKPFEKGYVLVPDGAGAIIEQVDNEIENLSPYLAKVYGQDPSHSTSYTTTENNVLQIKDIKVPVFGIAKPENNAAFVAFSKRGSEYLSINMRPDNSSNTQYSWAYPSYEYNFEYYQIYSKSGAGYVKVADERNHFTLEIQYDFLSGEDANYLGMAKTYRQYLIDNHYLTEYSSASANSIPMRLDFLMSDNESSLIGSGNVVSTTASQLEDILYDVKNNLNVQEAVVSMHGWQKDGKTNQHPGKAKLSSKVGTASQYEKLIQDMAKINYQVGFEQDYYLINNNQMAYLNNAAKHINGYYNKYSNYDLNYLNTFALARPDRSYDFVLSQHKALSQKLDYSNMTVDGIADALCSSSDSIDRSLAKQYIQEAFKYLKEKEITINAKKPNDYLWPYVSRYFDADAYDSALLIENETVPFLQYVLNNTMELYSNYCNYSFYDDRAICRMVDYNMYPSFMLTNDSAYYLLSTNSNLYFSTQYSEYKDLITKIYSKVNQALSKVRYSTWINREVNNNVVTNTYSNGKKIIINYNENPVNVDGIVVNGLGFEVI